MWMSDKPLVQEQLAEELSQLVHLFPHRQDGVTFCHTFFTTMAREWHSIDVIRREKFMMVRALPGQDVPSLATVVNWQYQTSRLILDVLLRFDHSFPFGLSFHSLRN